MLTNDLYKIASLDLGDSWVGIALSDATRILAKPYNTVTPRELVSALTKLFEDQPVNTVLVGYPKTMRGTESDQTKKVVATFEELQKQFPKMTFLLWDERLSSQRAQSVGKIKSKEDKKKSHAIAAAFILDSYLTYLSMHAE